MLKKQARSSYQELQEFQSAHRFQTRIPEPILTDEALREEICALWEAVMNAEKAKTDGAFCE